MTHPPLKLDAAGVNAVLFEAFPEATADTMALVQSVEPGRMLLKRAYGPGLLRPGGIISGPTLMTVADTSAYALVLAHIGDQKMAVTSSLVINFLRAAKAGDIYAEVLMLRLGRRMAVTEVRLWTESPDRLAAQATLTYALP